MLTLLLCLLLQDDPLSKRESELLELPLKDGLFDPASEKAERVIGMATIRTCYGKTKSLEAPAWRVPARDGRPVRFVLNNLQEVRALGEVRPAEFPAGSYDREFQAPSFAGTSLVSEHLPAQKLVWAAWLHRLGRSVEAARMLRTLHANVHETFRAAFGWQLFNHAVNAYMVGEDEEALPALERLGKFENPYQHEGDDLLAELRRRKNAGSFGRRTPALDPEFRKRALDERIPLLIDALDQIESNKEVWGTTYLDDQPAAAELLKCGEAAVPALLKCFEEDPRLTRAIGVWREWSPSRFILSVRGAAYGILCAILRTEHWNPKGSNPTATLEDPGGVAAWSRALKSYWEEFGKLSPAERYLRVLQDPASSVEAGREAAENLARMDRTSSFGRWGRWMPADDLLIRTPNPKLASYRNPTPAESILLAMDRHLKQVAGIGNWGEIEEQKYLTWLAELGDVRIVPELRRRHDRAEEPTSCRRYAFTLRRLGETGPMDTLAGRIEKGMEPRDAAEAGALIEVLGRSSLPACEKALAAIIQPAHSWYPRARKEMLETSLSSDEPWLAHPFCLTFLRTQLRDESGTGGFLTIENGQVSRSTEEGVYLPGFAYPRRFAGPTDPEARAGRIRERVCDAAAGVLAELIPDAPPYNPMAADFELRMKELRAFMDLNLAGLRRMTRAEVSASGLPFWHVYFTARDR